MDRTLLLVTGAGRSGTSTVAGALAHLGVHVPGPFLQANPSNPRGFYESQWSVQFHNRLLRRSHVSIADGRPEARERLMAMVTQRDRDELDDWLERTTSGHALTLVKDPRTTWTLDLLQDLARGRGIELVSLTMLRHPAEVIGSRATHYKAGLDQLGEVGYAARNLAGWTNALLMTERQTRGWRRAFLRYDDLLTGWRKALSQTLQDVRVSVDGRTDWPSPHPVDDFIDPALSRHSLTWEDVEVQPGLRALADRVWAACGGLADQHGHDAQSEQELDEVAAAYSQLYTDARHLAHDAVVAEAAAARRAGARAARRRIEDAAHDRGRDTASRMLRSLAGRAVHRLRRG